MAPAAPIKWWEISIAVPENYLAKDTVTNNSTLNESMAHSDRADHWPQWWGQWYLYIDELGLYKRDP